MTQDPIAASAAANNAELEFLRRLAILQWQLRRMHWAASKGDKKIRPELRKLGHETKRMLAEYIQTYVDGPSSWGLLGRSRDDE